MVNTHPLGPSRPPFRFGRGLHAPVHLFPDLSRDARLIKYIYNVSVGSCPSTVSYCWRPHQHHTPPHATIPTKPQHYTPSSLSHQAPETEREANPSLLRQQLTETTSPNHPTHAPRKKAGPIPQPTSLIPCIYLCVVNTPRLKSRRVQRRR